MGLLQAKEQADRQVAALAGTGLKLLAMSAAEVVAAAVIRPALAALVALAVVMARAVEVEVLQTTATIPAPAVMAALVFAS